MSYKIPSAANDNPSQPGRIGRYLSKQRELFFDVIPFVTCILSFGLLAKHSWDAGGFHFSLLATGLVIFLVVMATHAMKLGGVYTEREGSHAWLALVMAAVALSQLSSAAVDARELDYSGFQGAIAEETAKAVLPMVSDNFRETPPSGVKETSHQGRTWAMKSAHYPSHSVIEINFSSSKQCRDMMKHARPYTTGLDYLYINENIFFGWPSLGSIAEHCGNRVTMRFGRDEGTQI